MDKQSKLNVFKCLTLFVIMKCLDMPQLVPINIVDKIVKTSRED